MLDWLIHVLWLIIGDSIVVIVLALIVKSGELYHTSRRFWRFFLLATVTSYVISIGLYMLVHADTIFSIMIATLAIFVILGNVANTSVEQDEQVLSAAEEGETQHVT